MLSTPLAQEHGEGRDVSIGAIGGYHRVLRDGLRDAVDWARTPATEGRRPIDDPIVAHRLARALLACVVADEAPAGPPVRILGSQALIDGVPDLVDLAAPLSLLERGTEGALGDAEIEVAFRVGPETSIHGGTTDIARSLVAEHRLGLPGSRRPAIPLTIGVPPHFPLPRRGSAQIDQCGRKVGSGLQGNRPAQLAP